MNWWRWESDCCCQLFHSKEKGNDVWCVFIFPLLSFSTSWTKTFWGTTSLFLKCEKAFCYIFVVAVFSLYLRTTWHWGAPRRRLDSYDLQSVGSHCLVLIFFIYYLVRPFDSRMMIKYCQCFFFFLYRINNFIKIV